MNYQNDSTIKTLFKFIQINVIISAVALTITTFRDNLPLTPKLNTQRRTTEKKMFVYKWPNINVYNIDAEFIIECMARSFLIEFHKIDRIVTRNQTEKMKGLLIHLYVLHIANIQYIPIVVNILRQPAIYYTHHIHVIYKY